MDENMRYFALIMGCLALMPVAHADLIVSFIDDSRLPYEYSESNYANSPSNYSNSPSKNGQSSKNQLLVKDGSTLYRAGYYTYSDSGVTNFFSTSGKRMFYNPQKGIGVFESSNGSFSGVLVPIKNQYHLLLTNTGKKILLMSQ